MKMNALTNYEAKWNPFKQMDDLHNQLNSLFSRSLGRVPVRGSKNEEALQLAEWAPLVDISETDTEYLIKAELPEIRKEDLHVTVENGVLTLSGERKFEKEEKDRRYHRVERAFGSFARSFTVPEDCDPAKVNAEFKDGLLWVRLTKSERARPRSVEVKIA